MRTIIINGSPKGNAKTSNSRIICEEFVCEMKSPCEIKCIANADMKKLAHIVEEYDSVIFVLPLYIHAMPGIMMKFIEHLEPASTHNKSMGFIIQAGFFETQQHKYLERYFASLTKELNYNYLGTVSKGEAASIHMFPKMFKKILVKFNDLGRIYEQTNTFDNDIKQKLGKPYELTKFMSHYCQFISNTGLNSASWHKTMKKNNAYDKRLDKPFLY